MKQFLSYLLVCSFLLAAVSCSNSEFKKTKSGLLYKIMSDGKGEPAKKGEFLKVNVVQKLRDSILYTSQGSMPVYIPVDSPRPVYSPTEIFTLLRKGDSAVVVELADTLQRKFGGQLPAFIKKKDKISIAFKVLDVFPSEALLTDDRNQEIAKEKDREIRAVESYLADNKINAEKTAKGTYVVVNSVGDGPAVDSGKQVSVRYTGKLFPSGKVFESNVSGPDPLKFIVGQGQIIQGWDDGLRKFKKGGKGTLYIPAYLAYDQQQGPGHKPYENLVFEVEVVDVTDAPKKDPKAMPNMPQMPNGMPQRMPQGAQQPHPQPQQH